MLAVEWVQGPKQSVVDEAVVKVTGVYFVQKVQR